MLCKRWSVSLSCAAHSEPHLVKHIRQRETSIASSYLWGKTPPLAPQDYPSQLKIKKEVFVRSPWKRNSWAIWKCFRLCGTIGQDGIQSMWLVKMKGETRRWRCRRLSFKRTRVPAQWYGTNWWARNTWWPLTMICSPLRVALSEFVPLFSCPEKKKELFFLPCSIHPTLFERESDADDVAAVDAWMMSMRESHHLFFLRPFSSGRATPFLSSVLLRSTRRLARRFERDKSAGCLPRLMCCTFV